MSNAEIKVLQADVKEINKQLYAGYDRIIELLSEITDLKKQIADQQDIINALAESASARDRRSNG